MRLVARVAWPLGLAAAAFAVAVGLPAADSDMWWHLASGRWMVEHRDVLRIDVFSATATGEPYALGEQLGDVALYAAFAVASWPGLLVLRAALVAVAAFALARLALRGAPPAVAIPTAAAALVLSKPIWTDRPQLFTLALVPVVLELLFAARAGSRAALVATVPVVFVWSALHAGYAVGIALLWLFALAALFERRDATGAFVAAIVATFAVSLDPFALSLLRTASHVTGRTLGIVEESPVDVMTPFGALFALFVGATFLAFLRGRGSVLGALVLVPLLWLALSAQRHVPLFGFAAVPLIARAIASEVSGLTARSPRRASAARWSLLPVALWIAALASIATIPAQPDVAAYPVAALDQLRSTRGVLLNEYDWGGYLIWNAPERPVFVDGRLFPFTASGVVDEYRRALAVLPGYRATLDRWNVSQVLVRPARPLAQALRDDGWAVRGEGPAYVLLERPR